MSTATYATGSGVGSNPSQQPLSVYINRVFRAPKHKVFEAWTRADQMQRWRGPEGWEVLESQSDPRPGGKHRVVVRGTPKAKSPEEKPLERTGASWGEYLEVNPYDLIRFTWLADWAPGEESVVTVRLSDAEDGATRMEFTHDRFLTPESAQGHNQGWSSAFNKLAKFLQE